MTYSIVARDPRTGQMGVAVQSHWFSVGSVVTWARPGVGVVATQAFAEVSYGPRALQLLSEGLGPGEALDRLLASDEASDRRQVAVLASDGEVAVHTGARCIAEAGHRKGDGWSVQANMMLRDSVPDAMADAFVAAEGELVDRLLAALDAAETEGGDIRGRQSAAMLLVSGTAPDEPWKGTDLELRVEDHPEPLAELRRLVGVHRAYRWMNEGDEALATGDTDRARELYEAAQRAAPDNPEFSFWRGVTVSMSGDTAQARTHLQRAYRTSEAWRELLRRLPAAGVLPGDSEILSDP